ncbi:hypothetical protein [Lentzea albidocapillata]|uniref:hypothetical protein n=1 Tax=Lentzea albidocapillata TaxID=40571 RepID=UPI00115FB678|nr:hypothetical protein [Lentzea albidocapillata]
MSVHRAGGAPSLVSISVSPVDRIDGFRRMTPLEATVPVVVNLTLLQAAVLARAAVVVTSALDCKDANAAAQGLLMFRQAVAHAVSNDTTHHSTEQLRPVNRPRRRAG